MELETILNAYGCSVYRVCEKQIYNHNAREMRQTQTFRARILKMDAEKDKQIKYLLGRYYE